MPDSLTLHVHGATDAEIARGETAALAIFAAANRSPMAAATAFGDAELADDMGQLDEEGVVLDGDGIAAWLDAFPAAVAACCDGWTATPIYSNIIVRPEGDRLPPRNQAVTAEIDRLMALPDDALRALWAAFPDSSDTLNSLIYWAASERGLNSFPTDSSGTATHSGAPTHV